MFSYASIQCDNYLYFLNAHCIENKNNDITHDYLIINSEKSYNQIQIPIALSIDYSFKLVDSNGNLVKYCYEQNNGDCNTTKSDKIWIKSDLNKGNNTFYLIKTSDNFASNCDDIFEFCDNFNTLDLSKYTITNTIDDYFINNSNLVIYNPATINWQGLNIKINKEFDTNTIVETKLKIDSFDAFAIFHIYTNNYEHRVMCWNTEESDTIYLSNSWLASKGIDISTYNTYKTIILNTSNLFYVNDYLIKSDNSENYSTFTVNLKDGCYNNDDFYIYIDNIKVRKNIDSDLTYTFHTNLIKNDTIDEVVINKTFTNDDGKTIYILDYFDLAIIIIYIVVLIFINNFYMSTIIIFSMIFAVYCLHPINFIIHIFIFTLIMILIFIKCM
jgi:hypothetical protein